MNLEWEDIFYKDDVNFKIATARAKVKDGWLVTNNILFKDALASSMCFLPDVDHEWTIDKE